MHHIIYTSTGVQPLLSDADLGNLLRQAREYNTQHHITGVLLYSNGNFLQVLEGEQQALADLYARISADKRHQSILKLADKEIQARSFPAWSMAFQPVSPAEFAQVVGYLDPAHLDLQAQPMCAADVLLLHLVETFALQAALRP